MEAVQIKNAAWSIARWLLALALLVAGGIKIAQPGTFITDLENYRLITPAFAFGLGLYLPWWEITAALALISSRWRLAGWMSSVLLGLGFTLFVASAWWRGLDVSCGCFGAASAPVGPTAVARAVGIFVFSVLGFIRDFGQGRVSAARKGLVIL